LTFSWTVMTLTCWHQRSCAGDTCGSRTWFHVSGVGACQFSVQIWHVDPGGYKTSSHPSQTILSSRRRYWLIKIFNCTNLLFLLHMLIKHYAYHWGPVITTSGRIGSLGPGRFSRDESQAIHTPISLWYTSWIALVSTCWDSNPGSLILADPLNHTTSLVSSVF
jgi:hypothetical protein